MCDMRENISDGQGWHWKEPKIGGDDVCGDVKENWN